MGGHLPTVKATVPLFELEVQYSTTTGGDEMRKKERMVTIYTRQWPVDANGLIPYQKILSNSSSVLNPNLYKSQQLQSPVSFHYLY